MCVRRCVSHSTEGRKYSYRSATFCSEVLVKVRYHSFCECYAAGSIAQYCWYHSTGRGGKQLAIALDSSLAKSFLAKQVNTVPDHMRSPNHFLVVSIYYSTALARSSVR